MVADKFCLERHGDVTPPTRPDMTCRDSSVLDSQYLDGSKGLLDQ